MDSPIYKLKIHIEQNCVAKVEFNSDEPVSLPATDLGKKLQQQLNDYFRSPANSFAVPVLPQGTDFQARVWLALTDIPPGKVLTYGELAEKLGSSARAVGNACRRNPIPLIVPCHRIVAKSGIGGFAGDTDGRLIDIKLRLLEHEGFGLKLG
ncbi:MAG: methylated-DNA--[protein]-cysteine S-methyltransferase [Kangiellaceae bacterium]|nr:methylated-DNA--[protein]-cysteine S-methyltransferase [Kangiellaceae bacterium]